MFEEGQLYAPVTEDENGVTVHLTPDHPGANDPVYRRRREVIAGPALRWRPDDPVPQVAYTDEENAIWATVSRELAPKHERLAIRGFLEGKEALGLPTDRVPQLDEVSAGLEKLSGFTLHPAAGLVPLDQFYGSLADGVFHSTQYLRHGSQPLYTPEPDVIHEVVGHCNLLGNPAIAEVKRRAGEAARRCETPEGLQFVADVFWFTIEFGVMHEAGELRCYGAGLLSSYGEIEEFRDADVRPLDFHAMGTLEYDISKYQPVLFACDGMSELTDRVAGFFAEFTDDTPGRLAAAAAA